MRIAKISSDVKRAADYNIAKLDASRDVALHCFENPILQLKNYVLSANAFTT